MCYPRRYRQWIDQNPSQELIPTARYQACVMVDKLAVKWVVRKHALPPDEYDHEILSVTLVLGKYQGHRDPGMSSDCESDEDKDEEFEDFDPQKFDPNKPPPEMTDEQEAKALRREYRNAKREEKVSSEQVGISYLVLRAWSMLDGPGWFTIAEDRTWRWS